MSLRRNIIANYVGQVWRALMAFAFVPVYIRLLGIEAYGLIGLFAMLQAWLALLDMGLRPVLSREMARYTGGSHDAQSIADLLRTTEVLAIAIALAFVGLLWTVSGWLATDWVRSTAVPASTVAQAFTLMGVVAAVQFVESLYTSAIVGLQHQVQQNAIASFIATLRALGAVGVLMWSSATLHAYFLWQGLVSLLSLSLYAAAVYRLLPVPPRPARFSRSALGAVSAYAGGMVGITVLSFLLTQIDKVLLSRQVPLDEFAHYMLASAVAGALSALATPIGAAYYPRFTELAARGDDFDLRRAFHLAAQLTAIALGAAAVFLVMFGDRLLLHWTQDASLARTVAPLLSIIALGTMCNGLMSVPYLLQLAHSWTSLSIKVNCVAVALLVPALFLVVPRFGVTGAALIWTTLNIGYVLIGAQFMFARLITSERRSWYLRDLGFPIVTAGIMGLIMRAMLPSSDRLLSELVYLGFAAFCIGTATALSSPIISAWLRQKFLSRPRSVST